MSKDKKPSPIAIKPATHDAPQPTYAPAALAMGIAMLAWGLLTHWTMSLAGGGLIAWSLGTWMSAIARQWGEQE